MPTPTKSMSRFFHGSHQKMVLAAIAGIVVALAGVATSSTQAAHYPVTPDLDTGGQALGASTATRPDSSSQAPRSRQWPPTPQSVGVPKGIALSEYKGSCTIRKPNTVIDRRIINCTPVTIKTTGVVISNSKINGSVLVGTQDDFSPTVISDPEGDGPIRVTVLNSEIDASAGASLDFRPISSSHYVVKNSYLHGTYSGGECHNACTVKWSYVHGFGSHASGMRILRNGTLKHNTIWCEPNPRSDDDGNGVPDVDGGCSGNLTMYEEFGTPHNNLVKHNYFPAGSFWYSIKFNGSDDGNIRIIDNRFGLPKSGRRVADDWDAKSNNVWSGNTFTNGRVAKP